jgi:hypothetical protein
MIGQWLAVEEVATTDKSKKDSLTVSGDTSRTLIEEMKEYYRGLCAAILVQDKDQLKV